MHDDAKSRVRTQFSAIAHDYLESPVFAQGEDLNKLVEAAQLEGHEHVLDVACGAGHTALAMARMAGQCVGIDLTESMVKTAIDYAAQSGVSNVEFQVADAENLEWPDSVFDAVACRFAAHHFAAPERFIAEASRVLKPRGRFLIADHYAAEDDTLDQFVNDLNRRRDPSHVREPKLSEYRKWFESNGLAFEEVLHWDLHLDFQDWVARSRTPADGRAALAAMLQSPPAGAAKRQHIQLDAGTGQPISFSLTCVLLRGTKPDRI